MVGNVHGGERADDFHLQLLLLRIFERFAYELAGEAASSLRGRYFGVPQDDPALKSDFVRQVTDLALAFYFEALRLYVRQIGAHSNPFLIGPTTRDCDTRRHVRSKAPVALIASGRLLASALQNFSQADQVRGDVVRQRTAFQLQKGIALPGDQRS
jgi:hypothetical protein